MPSIIEIDYGYDAASNRTSIVDGREAPVWDNRDAQITVDDLHRLTEYERGNTLGSWNPAIGSQQWTYDLLGNWNVFEEDKTGDGDYGDTDEVENRSHNLANEITGRDPDDDTNEEITYTYDKVGNMRTKVDATSGTVTTTYTHDGWNRLVKVEVDSGGGATTRLENSYNGLNWRVSKRSDTDLNGSLDEQRVMYYNASWQLVEEEIYEGWTSGTPGVVDEQRAYIWGNRYIDDAVAMFVDTDVDDSYEDSPGSERYFYLTDAQFSVVAVMDDAANLQEKIQYDAYGRAIHHDWRDTDGDGDYDSTDRSAIGSANGSAIGGVNYSADYDVDRDGDVDLSDVLIAGTTYPTALSRGELSYGSVGNIIGYDGYVFNAVTELYLVRNRWYEPPLGRWLQRDPAGYVDGLNSYEYGLSKALGVVDPSGTDTIVMLQGPSALLVSWINSMRAKQQAQALLSVVQGYQWTFGTPSNGMMLAIRVGVHQLNGSSNFRPGNSFTTATFATWDASKEHRGWSRIAPKLECCNGVVQRAWSNHSSDVGWTPGRVVIPYIGTFTHYSRAEGGSTIRIDGIRDPFTEEPGKCRRFTFLSQGRLGVLENLIQKWSLTGQLAPFISREIEYEICCDGSVKVDFRGSYFPSHQAFMESPVGSGSLSSVGSRLQDNTRLGQFMFTKGMIVPTHIVSATATATIVSSTEVSDE